MSRASNHISHFPALASCFCCCAGLCFRGQGSLRPPCLLVLYGHWSWLTVVACYGMDFGCSAKASFRLTTYPGIILGQLH